MDGLLDDVLVGDMLQKRASGGTFSSTDPEVDRGRLAAGEVALTGPMFGSAMRGPPDGTPAHVREAALLASFDLGPADFHPLRAIAEGTRRQATILLGEPSVVRLGLDDAPGDAIRITFDLPAGAYATAVMREVQKPTNDDRGDFLDPDGQGETGPPT